MTTTPINPTRSIATIHTAGLPVPALLQLAQGIVTAMTGNALFPTPTPSLTVVASALGDLTVAETAAATRARGAVAVRNEKRLALVELLQALRAYVQTIADASPSTGASIIESAGFSLRKKTARARQVFSARQGAVSGTLTLYAPIAARRASYEWQYSTDGGVTWITMPPTLQGHTTLAGLTPLTTVAIMVRAVTKTGAENWSPPILAVVQ